MIEKKLSEALNDQMQFELFSAYVYLGFSAAFERLKLPGAAHWMKTQADEELIHANLFYSYLIDQEAEITLGEIGSASSKGKTALDLFERALKHEKVVTERINRLSALALKSESFATLTFLNYFLTEQIQEERSVQQIIDQLTLAGDSREALLFIDKELAARPAPTAPAAAPAN